MMDEQARIGFLLAMLKLNSEKMEETQILSTNLRKQYEKEKLPADTIKAWEEGGCAKV